MILQHWAPLNSKRGHDRADDDDDNDVGDEEDIEFAEFEKVAAFANPVQRRKKKGMDFRKWKEISQDDNSSPGKELEEDVSISSQTRKVDAKLPVDNSNGGFINSTTTMEFDTSNKVDHREKVKHAKINDNKKENDFVPERDHILSGRITDKNSGYSFNTIGSEHESTSLESEIDAENQARIKQMSAEEIAEAQFEIMEKINPALLKKLQKRGQEKLKKGSILKSEVGTAAESVNGHVQSTQDTKRLHTEADIPHTVMALPSEKQLDDENVNTKTSTTSSSGPWNAWSSRVEAIRELRFSLAGDVVDNERVPVYGMPYLFFVCFFI